MIYIDFETHSECDLKTAGAWEYSLHPTTGVFCMAWAIDDGDIRINIPEERIHPSFLWNCRKYLLDGALEAHNAFFERAIWENIMVPRYGWPKIDPRQWHCSAAKCAARGIPRSLEMAAQALGISEQKDMSGKKLMLKLSQTNPEKQMFEKQEDIEALYEYCKQDVRTERAISKALPDLSEKERKVWLLDQEINLRGVKVDTDSVTNALHIIEEYLKTLLPEVSSLTSGAVENVSQRDRTLKFLKSTGWDMPKLTKKSVADALSTGNLNTSARRILEIRQQISKTSTAKFSSLIQRAGSSGRIRDNFKYYGASTGRWAGQGVQIQNLPKGNIKDPEFCISLLKYKKWELLDMFYPDIMGAISSCIRGMLIAEEGKKLIAADYSAIEARVLFWLVGEERGVQMFRDGADIYVDMAMDIYRKKDISKKEREVGKAAVLGAGFQCGEERFYNMCIESGVDVTPQIATDAIQGYRHKFAKVKAFWYAIERAAITAVQNPGKPLKFGKLTWGYDPKSKVLGVLLPSGRRIAYNYAKVEWEAGKPKLTFMSVDAKKKWAREKTYGGKLTENCVQGIARDIMVHHMLESPEGIILTTHDEIVWEEEEEQRFPMYPGEIVFAIRTPEEVKNKMSVPPEWAKDLPLKVEAWEGKRYKK